jgi:hypothetical protein
VNKKELRQYVFFAVYNTGSRSDNEEFMLSKYLEKVMSATAEASGRHLTL